MDRLAGTDAAIEVWSNPPGSALWDVATWAGPADSTPVWSARAWESISCVITDAQWGTWADRALGVLSVAAGGRWTIRAYDPDRTLDPANPASPYSDALHPGGLVRLSHPVAGVVGVGTVDSLAYNLAEREATISGTDPVGLLSSTEVPLKSPAITTLRAFARDLIGKAGYAALTVEADPAAGDPAIGVPDPTPTTDVQVWAAITAAAIDCLHFAYIDRDLVVRFVPHADPIDEGLQIGCDGIPGINFASVSNGDGVYNYVTTKDAAGVLVGPAIDLESAGAFGRRTLERTDRKIPSASAWVATVLADRAFASVEYLPAEVWPTSAAELAQILSARGVALTRFRFDEPTPDVSIDARLIGKMIRVAPDGWAADLLTYVSESDWAGGVVPPEPEPPTPPPLQSVLRTVTSAKCARIAYTSGGSSFGAGAQVPQPVGSWTGWRNRMLVEFSLSGILGSDVYGIVSAVLRVRTTTQVTVGFGSTPKVRARRITKAWSEGSLTSPGSGNSVVWPGPTATSTGESSASVTTSQGATVDIPVTAIVRAWASSQAGGSGAANYGIQLTSWNETNDAYTTEFEGDDSATSSFRPQLRVTVQIPA